MVISAGGESAGPAATSSTRENASRQHDPPLTILRRRLDKIPYLYYRHGMALSDTFGSLLQLKAL